MSLCVLLLSSLVLGQERWTPPKSHVFTGSTGSHRFSVRFEQDKFQFRGRKVGWISVRGTDNLFPGILEGGKQRRIYGEEGWGKSEATKEFLNATLSRYAQVKSLKITVDGKQWPVSRKLFDDLLSPNFGPDYMKGSLSRDGKTLKIQVSGSDGAGGYEVKWTFRKNGKHTRTVDDNC